MNTSRTRPFQRACSGEAPIPGMKAKLKALAKRTLRPFNFVLPTKVNGHRFRVPIMNGVGASNLRISEPWMLDQLRRLLLLMPDSAFMDVGVNLGQTLLKIKALRPKIAYLGFEPNPFCVKFVNELIRVNDLQNCELVPAGLAAESGLLRLLVESEGDAAGSIVDLMWDKKIHRAQKVPVFAFDDIASVFAGSQSPIIKIDVEGAELEVITGMRNFLSARRPFLTCEILHAFSNRQLETRRERNQRLLQLLAHCGYLAYRLLKNEDQSMVCGLERIACADSFGSKLWDPRTSPAVCDYLLLPEEFNERTTRAFSQSTSI
jgi:FkbM family methyltransferase